MYSFRVLFYSGIPLIAPVSQLILGCSWVWPPSKSPNMMKIQSYVSSHVCPITFLDTITWLPSKSGLFHLGSTWNSIRVPRPKVSWFPLFWFKDMMPKHSFICWLAILDRQSTRARQHKFNTDISPTCMFCDPEETRNHLFLLSFLFPDLA